MESASRRLQQRENDVNKPFACTQNVRKTFVLPTAKNNVNGKQRIKRKSAVQKRRSSTPPFLLMLFYKPFPMQVLEKLTLRRFINQRFERNFLPFVVNQRLKNWRFRRWLQINAWKFTFLPFFCACSNVISMANIFCWGFVFWNLQSYMFAMQFLRESCFFAVKIVLYCLYGTGKFANKT